MEKASRESEFARCAPSWFEAIRANKCCCPTPTLAGSHGHGTKFTIILAISPCGKLWYQMLDVAGTSTAMFHSFVSRVLSRLPAGGPATRTFLWDNLTSHKSAVIFNTVTAAGHRCTPRPPYIPRMALWGTWTPASRPC